MYSCGSDRDIAIFILCSEETWVRIFNKSKGFHNGIWLHGHFKVTTGTIGLKFLG